MKYEILYMLEHDGGAIVNNASAHGLIGGPNAAYVASKHGVVGLTKSAALQYAQQGIRANAVCPGHVSTPLLDRVMAADPSAEARMLSHHPVGRLGEPQEIAEAVLWLCSDAASFVTGHAMAVDGGWVAQ
jgi:NAD(P)-dependent dehydrogenase (short-subunit alcohol dehydrogenase family)